MNFVNSELPFKWFTDTFQMILKTNNLLPFHKAKIFFKISVNECKESKAPSMVNQD